jgi:hypothetical protein
MIADYIEEYVTEIHSSNYSGINTVEKILADPGVSTDGSQHRVLFWHKTHRMAKVSKAFHTLSPKERMLLVIHHGGVIHDDGSRFTEKDLIQSTSMTTRKLREYVRNAKKKVGRFIEEPRNYQ